MVGILLDQMFGKSKGTPNRLSPRSRLRVGTWTADTLSSYLGRVVYRVSRICLRHLWLGLDFLELSLR